MEQSVLPNRQCNLVFEAMDIDLGFSFGWTGGIQHSYRIRSNMFAVVVNYREIIEYDDFNGEIKHHLQPNRYAVFLVNHRDVVFLLECEPSDFIGMTLSHSGKSICISYEVFNKTAWKAEAKRNVYDLTTGLKR